jgi:hypothetical protein
MIRCGLFSNPGRLRGTCGALLLGVPLACEDSAELRGLDPSPLEPTPAGSERLYAMMVQVLSPDGEDRSVYAVLSDTLDLSSVPLETAREFRGVANFAAVGGRLLVSSGEQPRIDSYEITPDYTWQEGPSVSFTNFGLPEDGANIFSQMFLDERTAYLPFDVSKRIVWDPTAMTILGTREASTLQLASGDLLLEVGGNRTGIQLGRAAFQPFFYHDEDWFEFGASSSIAVYDTTTHEEQRVLEAPCPGLALATRDETGNVYFSTWDYSPVQALYRTGPAPCVVRLTPDLQLDSAWTRDFTDLTGGRYSLNFRYIANGKALLQVLHHEELPIDFQAPLDPTALEQIWTGGYWRPWLVDVDANTAAPLEGLQPNSSGFQLVSVDGRNFIMASYEADAQTIAYELLADGTLRERFRTVGEVFKWVRVR